MAEYTKKWLSVGEQTEKRQTRGVEVQDPESCGRLLQAVGYYRLTGYLYPFRDSEPSANDEGGTKSRVLNR